MRGEIGFPCPACGALNREREATCYLCGEPLREDAPAPLSPAAGAGPPAPPSSPAIPAGASSLAGPPPAAGATPHGTPRPVPMLPFPEAEAANVRMSRLLFLLLFATFFALGAVIGKVSGSLEGGLAVALVLYAILASAAWFSGSSIVLSLHDARPADPAKDRQLLNVVEEMKIAAGIPLPKVYVMESPGMNAFAAGRRPAEAVVAVTTGLVGKLDREELQGVVAHEMAHIRSRDTLYNICAAVLVGAIALLSDMFLRDTFFFRGRRSRAGAGRGDGRGNVAFLILGIALALLAPLAAKILQMSISRQREYHADAAAAAFTRNPLGLASALEKIAKGGADVPGGNRGTQHLFIVNPLYRFGADSSALLSTHPPTELRIQRLRAMAGVATG
ncbi:MAG: M48 family metalloprotease [Deltaproteobacteria bacterium]|nr:M48 family metalloprotease [Deltaproteobacteria bacterium]